MYVVRIESYERVYWSSKIELATPLVIFGLSNVVKLSDDDSVKRQPSRKFTMFLVRGTLGLAVKLMKKLLTKWKVSDYRVVSHLIVGYYYYYYITINIDSFFLVGLPGVLFVLPDSYVDAEYKDYGGK